MIAIGKKNGNVVMLTVLVTVMAMATCNGNGSGNYYLLLNHVQLKQTKYCSQHGTQRRAPAIKYNELMIRKLS